MSVAAPETIPFEDVHDYDGKYFYTIPNEDVLAWRKLLVGLHIERAAGICSSGEVGFFSLLTHVRKELVLFDHSYRSICVAMLKYMTLQQEGAEATRALFTGDDAAMHKKFEELLPKMPEKVQAAFKGVMDRYAVIEAGTSAFQTNYLSRYWNKNALPPHVLRRASVKLDKVRFLHGDITDLANRGPFDLIYLSNALDGSHKGRGEKPLHKQWEAMVKSGGYVLDAYVSWGGVTRRKTLPATWEVVKTSNGLKMGGGWTYYLYKLPIKEV